MKTSRSLSSEYLKGSEQVGGALIKFASWKGHWLVGSLLGRDPQGAGGAQTRGCYVKSESGCGHGKEMIGCTENSVRRQTDDPWEGLAMEIWETEVVRVLSWN